MSVARPWRAPVLIALGVLLLDQLTKHWALNALSAGRIIEVVWTLQFNLAFNSGMAFSRGRGFGPYIAVIATLVIVWLLVSLRNGGTKLGAFGMGCLIGGAAGNLVDRLFRGDAWLHGSVVDFIDFGWFPIFNVADIAVNVGAVALILNSILVSRADARADASEDGDQQPSAANQIHPAIDRDPIDHTTEETP
jgi:signal peptidase II